MVISCCAVGCANRQGKANISFYRIPFDGERRQRWVAAISRKNWQPSKYSRICSEHFLQGQKSDDPLSPDYVPSVFVHTKSPEKRRALGSLGKYQVREAMKKKKRQELSKREAARALNLSAEMNALGEAEDKIVEEASISEPSVKCDAMCQTDLTSDYTELLEFECHGFLDNLLPGDLILADRGFRIQEQVGLYCARETPAFTRGEKTAGRC
uniref:THAP-type domain-containing protein n=3 Tax=Cyprinus carpio TaxID=7962 RepID=A0A8C1LVD3_CYPCA